MKEKKNTVRTVPKSNRKILESGKIDILIAHIYMTSYFSGLVQALIKRSNQFYGSKPPLLVL
jgi:hypothetical protein